MHKHMMATMLRARSLHLAKLDWKLDGGSGGGHGEDTLPETNIAPENGQSEKETNIPTIHF